MSKARLLIFVYKVWYLNFSFGLMSLSPFFPYHFDKFYYYNPIIVILCTLTFPPRNSNWPSESK